jgi:predicted dehydrogenase
MEKELSSSNSRRDFVKKASLAAAAFYIVPRHVIGKGLIAPSDKLNILSIGAGGKGQSDIMFSYNKGSENIVAIADVDFNRAADTLKQLPENVKKYRDWREALEKEKNNIDAVTISTPDHHHAAATLAAMQLGKHVYTQKPLTHNIHEARMLTEAAQKYKVVTQMGNQGSSNDGLRTTQEWFNAGLIGTVTRVHIWTDRPVWPQGIATPTGKFDVPTDFPWDLWLGPAPSRDFHPTAYHPFKWRGWWDFGTGAMGDMGCHLLDGVFKVLGLGYPTEVQCSVGAIFTKDWVPEYLPDSCPPSSKVTFKYPKTAKNNSDIEIIWYDGGIKPDIPAEWGDEPLWTNGVIYEGTKGKMANELYNQNPTLLPKSRMETAEVKNVKPTLYRIENQASGHNYHWVKACKAGYGKMETSSPFEFAGPLTEMILMGNLAIRSYTYREGDSGRSGKFPGRKKLFWDGKDMKITNFDFANQFVARKYRDGWKLG